MESCLLKITFLYKQKPQACFCGEHNLAVIKHDKDVPTSYFFFVNMLFVFRQVHVSLTSTKMLFQ